MALRDHHLAFPCHDFALALQQLGLGVERVDVADAPIAKNGDHGLRLGREVRSMRGQRRGVASSATVQQVGQGQSGDAPARGAQDFSST